MTMFTVRLRRREEIADRTQALHFDKPAPFDFEPGQAVDLILPGSTAADGANGRHAFSIVSAPCEPELVVATRMRDSIFKNALRELPIGSPAVVDGPFGSLTLHNDRARPAVFVAGGIGITPFMSMLRQATRRLLQQRLVLLYANRRPEDAAFLGELQQLERQHGNFRLVATMTRMGQSRRPWNGETGPLGEALLRKAGAGLAAPFYYLAGPPGMVAAVRDVLRGLGVKDDDLRSEAFHGY